MIFRRKLMHIQLIFFFFFFLMVDISAKEWTVKDYLLQVYESNFDIKKSILSTDYVNLDYEIRKLHVYTPQISYNFDLLRSKKDSIEMVALETHSFGLNQSLAIEQPIGLFGTKIGLSYNHGYKTPAVLQNFIKKYSDISSKTNPSVETNISAEKKNFSKMSFSLNQSLGRGGPFFWGNKNKLSLLKVKKQVTETQQKGVIQNTLIKSWFATLEYIAKKNEENMVNEELLAAQKIYQFKKEQFNKQSIRKTDLYVADSFLIQKEMKKKKVVDELQDLLVNLQKLSSSQEEFTFIDSGESMQLDLKKLQGKIDLLERPDISSQIYLQEMKILQNKIAFSDSIPKIDLTANINFYSETGSESWGKSFSSAFSNIPELIFSISVSSQLFPKVVKKSLLKHRIELQEQRESLRELQNQFIRDIAVSEKKWHLSKTLTIDSEKILQNSKNLLRENRKNLENGKIDLDDYIHSEERYEQSFELRNRCKLQEQMSFLSFLVNQGIQVVSLLYDQ